MIKQLAEIYAVFFKIGAITFGGGYSMLPFLQREVVDAKKWVSQEDLMDYFAVSQTLPGIIAINVATFCGNKIKGFWGAFSAAVGVMTPSIIIITLIASFIGNFAQLDIVQSALNGINIAVAVLLIDAVISMAKKALVDKIAVILAVVSFALMQFLNVSAPLIVIGSIAVAFLAKGMRAKKC